MKMIKFLSVVLVVSAFFSCNMQTECPKPEPPKPPQNLITYEKALDQLVNFNIAHPGVRGDQYAVRTWVSIEDLENYIAYAKAEGLKNKIEVNGIDFIYTQYKKGQPNMANEYNKDYELTFMYAPTYRDSASNKNEAFDPMNSKPGQPAKLSELLKNSSPKGDENTKSDSLNTDSNPENRPNGPSGSSGIANSVNTCPNICG